jgi:hypothetical protein
MSTRQQADTDTDAETPHDRPPLRGLVEDGLIGALGGLVGVVPLTVLFLGLSRIDAFSFASFRSLADVVTLAVPLSPGTATAVGYVVFVLGAMVTWPLVLASIGTFLPGDGYAEKGVFLGGAIWLGFAPAWYEGYAGLALVTYLGGTFFGHLLYGYLVGATFDRLFDDDRPYIAVSEDAV